MGKRVRQPTPRAHWALLGLLMVVLLAELSLNGYVTHVGSEGSGAPASVSGAPGGPVPDAVTGGGAVQRFEADGSVSSRSMPDKTIALTFDDGPDPVWTPRILAVLARHGAHATFFQVGSRVNEHPELARQVVAAGSEIGSHTFSHLSTADVPGWRDMDLKSLPVRQSCGGAVQVEKVGGNPSGDPFTPLLWLANYLPSVGLALEAGHVVTTGSCTGLLYVDGHQRVTGGFAGFGEVVVDLD